MAALDAAALELARSLQLDDVPAKLRCAQCNKIAVDAVKLPCCEQAICEPCSKDLPDECPVCGHSPLSAEECKPNRNLRMTIKAFLKNEEKKRGKDVGTTVVQTTEVAFSEPVAPSANAEPFTQAGADNMELVPTALPTSEVDVSRAEDPEEAPISKDDFDTGVMAESTAAGRGDEDDEDDEEDDIVITTERPEDEEQQQQPMEQDYQTHEPEQYNQQQYTHSQQQGLGNFEQQQQRFGPMAFGGNMTGFNPMMAMQTGMGMPGFGGMGMPNMMGMPGMNGMPMDPSMMFGGAGGMGDMSAMMGMGMGIGPMGMSGFGGMPGMGMNGPNGGFGYNNQNQYGSNVNQNFHQNRGYDRPYGRGYGRGRGYGFRGRGGFAYPNQNFGPQNFGHQPGQMNRQRPQPQQYAGNESVHDSETPAVAGRRGSPSYEPINKADGTPTAQEAKTIVEGQDPGVQDTNAAEILTTDQAPEIEHEDGPVDGSGDVPREHQVVEEGASDIAHDANTNGVSEHAHGTEIDGATTQQQDGVGMGIPTAQGNVQDPYYNDAQMQQQQGFGYGARGRGGFRGRGAYQSSGLGYATEATDLTPTPAPPANAPTGPKALREGKPNTGWYSRVVPLPIVAPTPVPQATSPPKEVQPRRDEKDDRERSHSRSRSRHRSRKHKDRENDYESEDSYRRRKDRERRKRKERERRHAEDDQADDSSRKDRSQDDSREERHRTGDTERHSSRSHRDRSREKRKHRHRSRSPEKALSVNGDEQRSRHKSKTERKHEEEPDEIDRIRDRGRSRKHSRREDEDDGAGGKEHSHRSSKHHRSSRDEVRDSDRIRDRQTAKPIEDDEIGFKIKGSKSAAINAGGMPPPSRRDSNARSSRRQSLQQESPTLASPAASDPYAEERERRHADRVLKEQQRRQSTQSLGKRISRDEEEVAPSGPKGEQGRAIKRVKGRKMNVKYEDELDVWR